MALRVLIRGGGDLGSGVALRLTRIGAQVVITELAQPLVVRRAAAYANAIFEGTCKVEETRGVFCEDTNEARAAHEKGEVAVLIDPEAEARYEFRPHVLIDARMMKKEPEIGKDAAPFVIGLGPGFIASVHCHAIIETKRGHSMGRVYWTGTAEADTQVPEVVKGYSLQRILRSPSVGPFKSYVKIGDLVSTGQKLAEINGSQILAEFNGVIRGLLADGINVEQGVKVGDLDPRGDPRLCYIVSDRALAVGGGVLEAILSRADLRADLCLGE